MSTLELKAGEVAHVDRKGQPMELAEWSRCFTDEEYSVVIRTEHEGTTVLTQWVGVADTVAVGVVYETYVEKAGSRRVRAWHSHWPCTEDEARAAHELVVGRVRRQEPSALSTNC